MALYVYGPTRYIQIRLSEDRTLHLFGDFHARRMRCPSDRDTIPFPVFLRKIFETHPRQSFQLLIEKYVHATKRHQRDYIDDVFNEFSDSPLRNVQVRPIDIRVAGLHRQISKIIKAHGYAVHFLSYLEDTDKTVFQDLQYRFQQLVRELYLDADKLFRYLKIRDETIIRYFRPIIEKINMTPREREAYVHIIGQLDHEAQSFTRLILEKNRIYKNMTGHFLRMGSIIVDLYIVHTILSAPPKTNIIVYAGTDHYREIMKFFSDRTMKKQVEADDETSNHQFQCLPMEDIMTNLQFYDTPATTFNRNTI